MLRRGRIRGVNRGHFQPGEQVKPPSSVSVAPVTLPDGIASQKARRGGIAPCANFFDAAMSHAVGMPIRNGPASAMARRD
jgi:hypothetical protein